MRALLLTDAEYDIVQGALGDLAADYENHADEFAGAEDEHRWTIAEVRAVEAKAAPEIGGLNGVLVTFGDGCDGDTWSGLFGHLEAGYSVDVLSVAGEVVEGHCTDVNDAEAGFVVDEVDEDGDGNGILHAVPVDEVAGVHIW